VGVGTSLRRNAQTIFYLGSAIRLCLDSAALRTAASISYRIRPLNGLISIQYARKGCLVDPHEEQPRAERTYKHIVDSLVGSCLPDCVLDAELVVLADGDRPSFQLLQQSQRNMLPS
jgi:hypothetical protein